MFTDLRQFEYAKVNQTILIFFFVIALTVAYFETVFALYVCAWHVDYSLQEGACKLLLSPVLSSF